MKKGVILEINDRYLTLLTPEGEFLRSRKTNNHYQVGEEIDFFPVEHIEKKRKFFFPFAEDGKAFAAAALALMLIIVSFLPVYQNNKVYAYVSIDINPSVELGMNDQFEVIKLIPYNEEGKLIIDNLEKWKKKDVSVVTEMIIAEIKEQGYLKEKQDIVLATVLRNDVKNSDKEKIKVEIEEIKQKIGKEKLALKVINASVDDRDKARDAGLTAGTYVDKQKDRTNESKVPPGLQKKEDKERNVPPGLQKKEDKGKVEPPGQQKKEENTTGSDKTPPGLENKLENNGKKNKGTETSLQKSNGKGFSKGKVNHKRFVDKKRGPIDKHRGNPKRQK